MSRIYRKIWSEYHGRSIPKDEFGRSYEIHHIDGNHENNSIENLQLVTLEEHYKIQEVADLFGIKYATLRTILADRGLTRNKGFYDKLKAT